MSGGSKTQQQSTTALRMNGDSGHHLNNGSHEGGNEMKSQQIHRSYSNAENTDAGNTDDPMVTSAMSHLDSSDDGTGYSKSPNSKKQEMERLKHKAIRPSARMADGSVMTPPVMNGTATTGIWQPRFMTIKKYSKNSRRPRGRYGRGLPKKGSLSFPVSSVSLLFLSICFSYVFLMFLSLCFSSPVFLLLFFFSVFLPFLILSNSSLWYSVT